MRLTAALAIPLLLSLAACGGGKPRGVVKFSGLAPNTAAQKAKDDRGVSTACPNCGNAIAFGATKCGVKRCETVISWDKDYPCPSCRATGVCSACVLLEQAKGECFDCAGNGVKTYAGKSPECPNCKGKKVCPICDGTRKCDYCKGTGRIEDSAVQAMAAKNAPKPEDEGGK